MKKAFVLLCVFAALLLAPVHSPECTDSVYEISFSEHLLSNDSVGNDWKISYFCNGEAIKSGERLTVSINSSHTITINISVTEKDKIPDVGTGTISVTLSGDSETKTLIIVTETGGINEGNEAQWEITCKVKLIKKK